jgi:hypothetical protein
MQSHPGDGGLSGDGVRFNDKELIYFKINDAQER